MSGGENGTRLVLDGFTVARGDRDVVRDVSLEIPQGQVTALLGPNGAGKSSLVLGVAGVLRPSHGSSITLDGQELAGKRPERIRRAGVAVVPEGRRLLSELTVEENIEVACYALSRQDAVAGRQWALELFPELEQRFDTAASSLSGGEQQMLVLAQALVSKPKFILIDELSLGLAPVVLKRLIPTIRTVAESGVGVLLIEQFATVALDLAQQVHVMDRGRIESSGSASQFKENPELLQSSYLLRGSLEAAG
jgi:branched-chain amino acid transport system ATP-binding protein